MFNRVAKSLVSKLHGDDRSPEGFLLTRRKYVDSDQELALGQSYLGLSGFLIFVLIFCYTMLVYGYPGGGKNGGYGFRFSSFAQMPAELKLLIPIAIASHLAGMISAFRLMINWSAISSQDKSQIVD